MIWKILLVVSLIGLFVGGAVWMSHGSEMFTKDREKVVTVEKDELFGTTTEKVEWKETFKLGLLPDSSNVLESYRSLAFIGGLSAAIGALSLLMIRKGKRTT